MDTVTNNGLNVQNRKLGSPVDYTTSQDVLILGNGPFSLSVASAVVGYGYGVVLVRSDNNTSEVPGQKGIEIFYGSILDSFSGEPGNFVAKIREPEQGIITKSVGAVIVASECFWYSPFTEWGIELGEGICSISQIEENIEAGIKGLGQQNKVAFLCGFTHLSHPCSQHRIVKAALRFKEEYGADVYVLMEHFKVAQEGLERLIRNAREAGVLFVKFTDSRPGLEMSDGKTVINYFDEALGGNIRLTPDLLILEEAGIAPPEAEQLSGILEIQLDSKGFFQGDHIYNFPIFTNRTGIFVVGSAKGPISNGQASKETKAAVLEVHKLLSRQGEVKGETVRLDRKKCTICLTCYRVCPHRAISYLNRRPVISPLACYSCGICTSVCPMEALELVDFPKQNLYDSFNHVNKEKSENGLMVFACQNSAFEAYELARRWRLPIPDDVTILKVPCGGKVDPEMVLKAFRTGAKGVMILTCHHDSCKSVMGSHYAQWRAEDLKDMLEEIGISRDRLFFGTLASGMANEFVDMVKGVADRLRSGS